MPACKHLARFELVHRAAIGALAFTMVPHVDVHLGVGVPQLHVSLGAGAVHAALLVQVFGSQFDNGRSAHGGCLSHRWTQPVHAGCVNVNSVGGHCARPPAVRILKAQAALASLSAAMGSGFVGRCRVHFIKRPCTNSQIT